MSFFISLSSFLSKNQPLLRVLWLALVLACLTYVVTELSGDRRFDTSVVALLPDGRQQPIQTLANTKLLQNGEQRLVFLVSSFDKSISLQAAQEFSDLLFASKLFQEVQGRIDGEQIGKWQDELFPYRYGFLTEADRTSLTTLPINESHPILQRAIARLYSPMAASVSNTLLEDPLQLFYQWQISLGTQSNFTVDNDWLSYEIDGEHYRLISATLLNSAYDMSYQQRVLDLIEMAKQSLQPTVMVQQTGLLFHAAYGAKQAQREISTIGLGSLIGITVLLLLVLRRVRFVLLAFLPIFVGLLFSFALCLFFFQRLHLITLAFGAGLVGVAIDYSLHYLCATYESTNNNFEKNNGRRSVIRQILPAILLGLFSSVIAYAAQSVAPFPGLRQMAVFSVCGLVGAWLTVVLWLPVFVGRNITDDGRKNSKLGLLASLSFLLAHWPTTKSTGFKIFLLSIAVIATYVVTQVKFDDDVRRLQTSPPSMLEADARVQSLIGGLNPGQYFVVSASDVETLLQVQERVAPSLEDLIQTDDLGSYQTLANLVPSAQRQQDVRGILSESVYSDSGLLALLAEQLEADELTKSSRDIYIGNDEYLIVEDWLQQTLAETMPYLWLGEEGGKVHGLITLSGIRDVNVVDALEALAQSNPDIIFIDNVGTISTVLQHHRLQIQQWLVLAYIIVLCLLFVRYGLSAWRLLAAPALASLITIALLGLGQATINIFSLLALLLVLGIGLDASIFLNESKRSAYTWVAISLSALTTLLAFGLLSLSATPVLHQFGITVLLGIIGVWLLAPCFVEKPKESAVVD